MTVRAAGVVPCVGATESQPAGPEVTVATAVNGIAPGAVLLPDQWNEDDATKLRESTPLRRLGSPDDVVGAMLYLLRADYVTGETMIVDGGRHVRR